MLQNPLKTFPSNFFEAPISSIVIKIMLQNPPQTPPHLFHMFL